MHVQFAQFRAAVQDREYLARIQLALRVKDALDALLLLQVLFIEHRGHELFFLKADTVFTGQDATDFHAQAQDIRTELFGFFQFLRVVRIKQDQRVQVAVAGMKHVCHLQSVLVRHFPDPGQYVGEFPARDGAVHTVVIRRNIPQRRKGRFSSGPDAHAFFL